MLYLCCMKTQRQKRIEELKVELKPKQDELRRLHGLEQQELEDSLPWDDEEDDDEEEDDGDRQRWLAQFTARQAAYHNR